jgi:lipopolysaccharide biosynthesis glycosyltransferase
VVVATSADDNYAAAGALALISAARSVTPSPACLFVDCGLKRDTLRQLRQVFEANSVELTVAEFDDADLDDLPVDFHISSATYGRFSVPRLAKDLAARTLYLDPDTLTIGSIDELISTDLYGRAVAAVQSHRTRFVSRHGGVKNWDQLGLPPATAHFNAGVLLIDNAVWLNQRVSEKAIQFLKENPDEVVFLDQDALNAALRGEWIPIDDRWNVPVARSLSLRLGDRVATRHGLLNLENQDILHFLGSIKPWEPSYAPSAHRRLYSAERRRFGMKFDVPRYWSPFRWARARP